MKKVLVLLLLITILTTVGCSTVNDNDIDNDNDLISGNNSGLEGDITDWAIVPDADDSTAMIDLAVSLYEHANDADKNLPYRKAQTYGLISQFNIQFERYIFNVKNDNEWYYSEAQYSEGLYALFSPPFVTLKYGELSKNKTVVLSAHEDISVDSTTGVPKTNLDKAEITEESLPIFNSTQEGIFTPTDFCIERETIKSASVKRNDEGGYYEVTIELDVENPRAIANPLAALQSNVSNAKYTSCTEYIEIWYSGHYKYFNAIDKWEGKMSIIDINSTIDYRTYYTYDLEECNIDSYYGIEKLKAEINSNEK